MVDDDTHGGASSADRGGLDRTVAADREGSAESASSAGSAVSASAPKLARGAQLGRYTIVERLGAGAMGVVYLAFDPELDRRVAVKLLLPRGGRSREAGRARLVREAQAMARLAHPNVVAVHDVGVHQGRVFVAMEYVSGSTLARWSEAETRPWRQVVQAYAQAGRGLAAAHRAGLVHRDFKPENAMIDERGSVRVMDFGLARSGEDEPDPQARTATEAALASSAEALATPLTQTGVVLGTPAYMSPEQFAGEAADARSDQFSFCVALYEGLYGERPFAGESVAALAFAVTQGEVADAPRGSSVPGWVRRVVLRGLAAKADDRWNDMDALLRDLSRDPARRRRRWLQTAAVAGLVAGPVWAYSTLAGDAPPCVDAGRDVFALWDDAARERVRTALTSVQLPYADDAWAGVEPVLDAWSASWAQGRREACEATHVTREQSAQLLDRRMACLDTRLNSFGATVEVLEAADASVVRNAIRVVHSLPEVAPCADVEALLHGGEPPADAATVARVREVEARLAEIGVLRVAGRHREGLGAVEALLPIAESLGHDPTLSSVLNATARLQLQVARYEDALATTERAFEVAVSAGDDRVAADASGGMISLLGYYLARPDDAATWVEHARAWARAAGTSAAHAIFLTHLGTLASARGDHATAIEHHLEALQTWERQAASGYHDTAVTSLSNLGNEAYMVGQFDRAIEWLDEALRRQEAGLGRHHPDVAELRINLGAALDSVGRVDDAEAAYREGIEVLAAALGERHPNVANGLNNLAALNADRGRLDEAERGYRRAHGIYVETYGAEHPDVGLALNNLAEVAAKRGRHEDALRDYQEALRVLELGHGATHPYVAYPLVGSALALVELGRPGDARPLLDRAGPLIAGTGDPGLTQTFDDTLARARP